MQEGNRSRQNGGLIMKIALKYRTDTKTCYRFKSGTHPDLITLDLKKKQVDNAGIDPKKEITITVEEGIK